MLDNGEHIEISFDSSIYSVDKNSYSNRRIVLGYISGVYNVETDDEVYATVYYKRNEHLEWESITYKIKKDEKRFYQKLPAGLTVIEFYIRIFGWVKEFELTSLKVSVKEIAIGKFAGSSLLLYGEAELQPPPPSFNIVYTPFEIKIPLVGDLKANQATVTWATTHKATSKVKYGISQDNLNQEVFINEYEYYHKIILQGLNLEEIYYCKIYSISELTKEEISSEILQFTTGKEITLQSNNLGYEFTQELRNKNLLNAINFLNETEMLNTIEPDFDLENINSIINSQVIDIISRGINNKIESEFNYNVTP